MTAERESYLGDGLYAAFDIATDTVWLRAPRLSTNHVVALEPHVLIKFIEYACEQGLIANIERALNNHREKASG